MIPLEKATNLACNRTLGTLRYASTDGLENLIQFEDASSVDVEGYFSSLLTSAFFASAITPARS